VGVELVCVFRTAVAGGPPQKTKPGVQSLGKDSAQRAPDSQSAVHFVRGLSVTLWFLKSMSDVLIAKIARRAAHRSTQIDMGDMSSVPKRASSLKPADAAALEAELGLSVPVLLERLYEEVGNGGFAVVPFTAASTAKARTIRSSRSIRTDI
jgi:DNA-directed RNA polymerase subunit K/omega